MTEAIDIIAVTHANILNIFIFSPYFSKVLVSTDSEEIASHSRDFGAEVPFLRDEFYDDITPVSKATCDALIKAQEYWGIEFNTVTQLMANCLLRKAEHISSFYKKFEDGIYAVDKDGEKTGTKPVNTEVLQTVYSNYSN